MALFGSTWDTPNAVQSLSAPSDRNQGKKRKRNELGDSGKNINLDKLMQKMAKVETVTISEQKRNNKREKQVKGDKSKAPSVDDRSQPAKREMRAKGTQRSINRKQNRPNIRSPTRTPTTSVASALAKRSSTTTLLSPDEPHNQNSSTRSQSKQKKQEPREEEQATLPQRSMQRESPGGSASLTLLQSTMQDNLEGAKFRFINEQLYKSSSHDAHDLMRNDPEVYAKYHAGFRRQTKSWPVNPVTLIASSLSALPARSLIVDLGCGDAQLAKTLVPKGLNVLSFDLVSDGSWVVEADTCNRIPLPGGEHGEYDQAMVDACVCSLSLMSTNWVGCVRETWRVLRQGGRFTVAEVTSRFQDKDEFVGVLSEIGFELIKQTSPSTHFLLFEFKKVARGQSIDEQWEQIQTRASSLLKPCEYKRR